MCCSSKKKPVQPQQSAVGQSNVKGSYLSSSSVPKSVVKFSAIDYQSSPMVDQSAFVATKRSQAYAQALGDRQEDYSRQINTAKESKLIQPKEILTYDLDKEDGVSKTPVINTFHYESQLSHCFLHTMGNNTNIHNSGFRATESSYANRGTQNYQNQAYQGQNSALNNSNLYNPHNPEVSVTSNKGFVQQDSRISRNSKNSR